MPIDPYAAVNAIIRAEVARTGPVERGTPGPAEREPEAAEPAETARRDRGTGAAR
ncbi:hypothetical protein ACFU5O_05990 [Streptomyces sp. NPDC057445]|uniref:hypothetical protein n=1 Tax=Streptomyces sp. NPDC057445 TaxID=3346136 RepID=UPI0036CF4754